MNAPFSAPLRETPLAGLHRDLGGRMVGFAGWSLPVMYDGGVIAEHLHVRTSAGLFDISHMGQIAVQGTAAKDALQRLVTADFRTLAPGRMRYALLLNGEGGVIDDLMITDCGDHVFVVANAAHAGEVHGLIASALPRAADARLLDDSAMLALQGPLAESVLTAIIPEAASLRFLDSIAVAWNGAPMRLWRSGYTGEDGFEISLPAAKAESLARRLLKDERVHAIGLGARDSLRLEAGLPLAGQDIGQATTPIEADLLFAIGKARRTEGGFTGAGAVLPLLAKDPVRRRVGLIGDGRRLVRHGAELTHDGVLAGVVTSGGLSPTLDRPIAMAYVNSSLAKPGETLTAAVRGVPVTLTVTLLPFVPHRYVRRNRPS